MKSSTNWNFIHKDFHFLSQKSNRKELLRMLKVENPAEDLMVADKEKLETDMFFSKCPNCNDCQLSDICCISEYHLILKNIFKSEGNVKV